MSLRLECLGFSATIVCLWFLTRGFLSGSEYIHHLPQSFAVLLYDRLRYFPRAVSCPCNENLAAVGTQCHLEDWPGMPESYNCHLKHLHGPPIYCMFIFISFSQKELCFSLVSGYVTDRHLEEVPRSFFERFYSLVKLFDYRPNGQYWLLQLQRFVHVSKHVVWNVTDKPSI